ncbi:hypothetical protein AYI68_g4500, partial [Smittium mucronatum]
MFRLPPKEFSNYPQPEFIEIRKFFFMSELIGE